jgi:hypothetical protein
MPLQFRLYSGHFLSLCLLDGEIKTYKQDFCNINLIPLNKLVMRFYDPIAKKNKEEWSDEVKKEVCND